MEDDLRATGQAAAAPTRRVAPRPGEVGLVLLPAATLLVVSALLPAGPEGRFRGALAGLAVLASLGAFAPGDGGRWPLLRAPVRVGVAAVLLGLAFGLRGLVTGSGGDGLACGWLGLGVGLGALGLAAAGRAMRTPAVAAGAVAACVLWTAMAGLFWADGIAEHVPRTARRPFRQAVLHVDPALALAYGAAGFDRLRTEDVYFDVPLASSFYDRPTPGPTGAVWLVVGLVGWVAALLAGRCHRTRTGGADGASAEAQSRTAGP